MTPETSSSSPNYRIEEREGGFEPQMLYVASATGMPTWFPLLGNGYWAEPDAYLLGNPRVRSVLPTREAAQRAITRASAINHEHLRPVPPSSHDPVEINPMTDSDAVSARGQPTQAASSAVPEQTEPGSPPLPWAYRPQEMDDWGCIRSADGRTVAHIRSPWIDVHGDDANAHRRARTDPYGQTARLIVCAVNAHDDLVAALKLIVEHGDKTLIMATDAPHERQAYSLGANRAFGQMADIARSALDALAKARGDR